MVKHSKKLGKKDNVNRKNQSRKRVKRSGKQVSKLGRQGRSGRRASMRSVKSVIGKKRKQKMQRGGDNNQVATLYAYYDIPDGNDRKQEPEFVYSYVELPIAQNSNDPDPQYGAVLYRAFADGELHKLIDEAGIKNEEIEDQKIDLNVSVPNNFLGEVTKKQSTMISELTTDYKQLNFSQFLTKQQPQSAGAAAKDDELDELDITPYAEALFIRQINRINEYLSLIQKLGKIDAKRRGGFFRQVKAEFFFGDNTDVKLSAKNLRKEQKYDLEKNNVYEAIKSELNETLQYLTGKGIGPPEKQDSLIRKKPDNTIIVEHLSKPSMNDYARVRRLSGYPEDMVYELGKELKECLDSIRTGNPKKKYVTTHVELKPKYDPPPREPRKRMFKPKPPPAPPKPPPSAESTAFKAHQSALAGQIHRDMTNMHEYAQPLAHYSQPHGQYTQYSSPPSTGPSLAEAAPAAAAYADLTYQVEPPMFNIGTEDLYRATYSMPMPMYHQASPGSAGPEYHQASPGSAGPKYHVARNYPVYPLPNYSQSNS